MLDGEETSGRLLDEGETGTSSFCILPSIYPSPKPNMTRHTRIRTAVFLVFNILFWKLGRKRINHLAGLLRPNSADELPAFVKCSNCGKTYASNINACPKCNQSTEKTLLALKDSNNDFENQNLHDLNKFSSNHGTERTNKNPYDV